MQLGRGRDTPLAAARRTGGLEEDPGLQPQSPKALWSLSPQKGASGAALSLPTHILEPAAPTAGRAGMDLLHRV